MIDRIKLRAVTYSGKENTRINLYGRPTYNKEQRLALLRENGLSTNRNSIEEVVTWEYLGYLVIPNTWSKGLNSRLTLSEVEQWTDSKSTSGI